VGAGGGQLRIRLTVMAWRGEGTSPPRLSRCRMVLPLLAGSGWCPQGGERGLAAAALGVGKLTMAGAVLTGPTP